MDGVEEASARVAGKHSSDLGAESAPSSACHCPHTDKSWAVCATRSAIMARVTSSFCAIESMISSHQREDQGNIKKPPLKTVFKKAYSAKAREEKERK